MPETPIESPARVKPPAPVVAEELKRVEDEAKRDEQLLKTNKAQQDVATAELAKVEAVAAKDNAIVEASSKRDAAKLAAEAELAPLTEERLRQEAQSESAQVALNAALAALKTAGGTVPEGINKIPTDGSSGSGPFETVNLALADTTACLEAWRVAEVKAAEVKAAVAEATAKEKGGRTKRDGAVTRADQQYELDRVTAEATAFTAIAAQRKVIIEAWKTAKPD